MNSIRRTACIAFAVLACLALNSSPLAQSVEQLEQELLHAYENKQYEKALELGRKLMELAPQNPGHAYNVACLYALSGNVEQAIEAFEKSAQLGFDDANLAGSDPDLAAIRGHAEYKKILDTIKANHEKTFSQYRAEVEKGEPLIYVPSALKSDKPAPCIVVLHPYGGTAEWILERWRGVADKQGCIVVAPRAVIPQGPGYRWQDPELAETIVARSLRIAREKHKIDDRNIILSGFSEGAMMTYVLALRNPDLFRGAIPVAGSLPDIISGWDRNGKRPLPRFFIMIGEEEPPLTLQNNRDAVGKLEAAGAKVRIKVYPGVAHTFPPNHEKELAEALYEVMSN